MFSHLVAKCFIGERPEGYDIDHIDRNPLNNNVSNLRYVTHKENCFNKANIIQEIPIDTPNRKSIVQKKWTDENKEILSEKKKQYYQKNKEKWEIQNEIRRNDKITLMCPQCNLNYEIQKNTIKYKKTDLCSKCSSLNNLKMILVKI